MADVFFTGAPELAAALDQVVLQADAAARAALAELAESERREAAAGAPHASGRLASSYEVDGPHAEGFGRYVASVGPTVIYGRRVEQGYHGTDRIGRAYDQSGHPSLGPAHRRAEMKAEAVFTTAWARALR